MKTTYFLLKKVAKKQARDLAITQLDFGFEVACWHCENKTIVTVTDKGKDTVERFTFYYITNVYVGDWCKCWNEGSDKRFVCKVVDFVTDTHQPIFEMYDCTASFDMYVEVKISEELKK